MNLLPLSLHLVQSILLSLSLSPRPTVYLDAKTCIERGKRRAPSILYRSIDPCFFSHAILDAILTAALTAEHPERGIRMVAPSLVAR